MAKPGSAKPVALITGAAGGLGLIVTQMFLDADIVSQPSTVT